MKKRLINLSGYMVIALIVFILSSLNGEWTRYVNIACISLLVCSFVCVCVWMLTRKQKNLLWFALGICLFSTSAFAAKVEECANLEGAELTACIFEKTCSDSQSLICDWAGRLDPAENYTEDERKELTEAVTQARWLTSHYTELDSAYKTHNCSSGGNTSDCYCCARLLQTLHTLWSARHGGTGSTNVETVPQILNSSGARCWPCDVVLIFLIVTEHLIMDSASVLSAAGLLILTIFTCAWLLYRVFKLALDVSTAQTFWSDLIKRLLLVMTGAILLGSVVAKRGFGGSMLHGLYMYTVIPLIETVIGVNDLFMQVSFPAGASFFGYVQEQVNQLMNEGIGISYCPESPESISLIESRAAHFFSGDASAGFGGSTYLVSDDSNEFGSSGRVFPKEVIQGFMCMTQRIYNQITPLTAVGNVLVSAQAKRFSAFFGVKIFDENMRVPSISMLIYGLLLYIPCILFSFIIAFEVLDIFMRMLFVFPLTPIWIVCALFPATRKYATQTCKFLFSLLMDFLGIVIGVAVMLAMVEQMLPNDFVQELICWIFDTTREQKDATTCTMPAGGLNQNIFIYSNKYYADHLFYGLTHEYGYRVMFVVLGMYFFGRKIFFSTRSTFRELLGASAAGTLGASILGAAVMKTQVTTRKNMGKVFGAVGKVPGMKKVGELMKKSGDFLLNSLGSAGQRSYDAVANKLASGVRGAGEVGNDFAQRGGDALIKLGGTAQGVPIIGTILGALAIGAGGILKGIGVAAKYTLRAASYVIRATKYVARVVIAATKRVVRMGAKGGSSLFKRFFFIGGGKKPEKEAKKNDKKDSQK